MRNLGKPLRDTERHLHVCVCVAAGRQTDRRDEAGSRDGLRSARGNLGKTSPTTIIPLAILPALPPRSLLPFTAKGFPLTFGFSGGHFWPQCFHSQLQN